MKLIVDQAHPGTSERIWQDSGRLSALPNLHVVGIRKVILVFPHPDDEITGSGGLLQELIVPGVEIELTAVTEGEGSHAYLDYGERRGLVDRRQNESLTALHRLASSVRRSLALDSPTEWLSSTKKWLVMLRRYASSLRIL